MPSYVAWVCDRPFTTVNFGVMQLSCAQLNQFVPGNLVVAGSVVMAGFSVCDMCMPVHDDRKWWSCGEASGNSSDISVSDGGDGQSQWVWQQVVFITGDRPAAGTGLLCRTVTAAGAGCEFVAGSIAPFLQDLVDNVGLSRYGEMRDLLSDVIYVLGKLDMRGSCPCKIPNFPSGEGCVPSGLPVRQQAGFDPLIKWDSLAPLM